MRHGTLIGGNASLSALAASEQRLWTRREIVSAAWRKATFLGRSEFVHKRAEETSDEGHRGRVGGVKHLVFELAGGS